MRSVNRKLPLFLAVMGCLYGSSALAQSTPQDKPQSEQPASDAKKKDGKAEAKSSDLGTVTVTGSLIKRKEFDSISPVQVITADTSVMVGQTDTAQFLQKSSVAAGATQITNQFSGFVVEGGTGVQTISLRGLGANRTLVLLNGNRPGPGGTQGQVGAFDLNVIPQIILQRAEILKDGSSSIYGSDAVAGVVNLITRKNISKPEISITASDPVHGGGKSLSVSGLVGWNFNRGNIALAASLDKSEALKKGDRSYLSCSNDLTYGTYGQRIDRQDRSILAGSKLAGCNNMYFNTVIDVVTGRRYIPSPDGTTVGMIPGYRPRANKTYGPNNTGQAYYEDVLNGDFLKNADIVNRQQHGTLYGTADFALSSTVNFTAEVLYNQRKTEARGFRQFFPIVATNAIYDAYSDNPNYVAKVPSGLAEPIMPFRDDWNVKVDYLYGVFGLDGQLPFKDWTWKVSTAYTRSKGTYEHLDILKSKSGDANYTDIAPKLDYFDPGFLNGSRMNELVNAIGAWTKGTTTYNQLDVNGSLSGTLFHLPAGDVGAAFGVDYRRYSINDQPSVESTSGNTWGYSSAQITRGTDKVKEVFGEIEVPLLKGIPGIEALTANASARAFKYDSVKGGWDNVWKLGLSWQITPAIRLRATKGTSFRAPGLYELYLGNLSGFVSQTSIDPCINWGDSQNPKIRANCSAAGIPNNYTGGGSTAEVFQGGGAGFLKPETSRAFSGGIVFTPSFAPISVALDYYDYQIFGEITSLGASTILGGCYGATVYPNDFCKMFSRNAPNAAVDPNKITTVHATYVNINKERARGYDMIIRYDNKFSFGKLEVEANITRAIEDTSQLFSTAAASGFSTSNATGYIGYPKWVGDLRTSLRRNDFTYTWGMNYVGQTKNFDVREVTTATDSYFGYVGGLRLVHAKARLYHTASVQYSHGNWSMLFGVRNLFDSKPPLVSSGVATKYGNIPAFATQYDIYGRTLFGRFNYKF
ncbi:TonB-dependent receptor plug domain-containing protein [Solilutibacter silvestris]|uniref:TonB-dependent receptor plug domain-containing protein n=1 Tax=Solilutibacter silvestris TaxID=1645665 RepID=UPI003D357919